MLTEILPGHKWDLEHTSAWLNVFRGREEPPALRVGPRSDRLDIDVAERAEVEKEP